MMWKSMLNMLVTCMVLRAPEDAGGSAAPDKPAEAPIEAGTADQRESESSSSSDGRPTDMTKQEWDNLTPGEQAGMRISDEEIERAESDEDDELDPDDLEAIANEGETKPADDGKKPAEGETKPVETVVLTSEEDLLSFRPTVSDTELTFDNEVPAEIQTELDALDTKIDDLEAKFDDGDLTRTELNKAVREVNKEREAVNRKVMQHQIQARDAKREEVVWLKEQSHFFTAHPEYSERESDGKTVTVKADAMYGAFNKAVERLNAKPENATKSGMQILVEANRLVRQAFGMTAEAAKPAGEKKPLAPRAKLDPKAVNLSQIPAAGDHDADPFSYIDRMTDPYAKEQALANLTGPQLESYLKVR
jgi:hypothetical protein